MELPAVTPHKALRTLEKLSRSTLGTLGSAGDKQSSIIAVSLKTSAASLYILHSGSSEVPSLCAKRMVANLPILSCMTERSKAAVGDADASPTPTPVSCTVFRQMYVKSNGICWQKRKPYLQVLLERRVGQQWSSKRLVENPIARGHWPAHWL